MYLAGAGSHRSGIDPAPKGDPSQGNGKDRIANIPQQDASTQQLGGGTARGNNSVYRKSQANQHSAIWLD
jgi:hypothetical protein